MCMLIWTMYIIVHIILAIMCIDGVSVRSWGCEEGPRWTIYDPCLGHTCSLTLRQTCIVIGSSPLWYWAPTMHSHPLQFDGMVNLFATYEEGVHVSPVFKCNAIVYLLGPTAIAFLPPQMPWPFNTNMHPQKQWWDKPYIIDGWGAKHSMQYY